MYILSICIVILALIVIYKVIEVVYIKQELELRERQIDGLRLTIEAYKELSALDKLIPDSKMSLKWHDGTQTHINLNNKGA